MKQFLKMVLAVIVGLIAVSLFSSLLFMAVLGAVAAVGSSTAVVPSSCVLTIDMSNTLVAEQASPELDVQSIAGGTGVTTVGLWDAVQALNAAAADPAVKMVYLKTDGALSSIATMQELRRSLAKFRESGKPVVSYIESPTTGTYYLASVADKVYMTSHPGATTMVNGVGSQMIFLKDLLDKLGVNVQLIRHGKYKSAGEMYTRSQASPENLEQYQVMVNSMWASLSTEIAASRSISVEALNDAIDNLKLCIPSDYLECGLVDELFNRDQLEEKIADLAVAGSFKNVKTISLADYVSAKVLPSKARKQIAVVYADGEIVDGKGLQEVAGDRFASVIRKLRTDETVKAVVLRVNSPGGSVLASEKIKHEIDSLRVIKPVIASYGDYAASGGYWISNNCDKIFSDAVTLTGSIGVFGMIPDLSRTLKDVAHVNITSVTSNDHGDMFSLMRPFDQAEYNYMLRSIEDIYDRFTTIVSEGRGIEKETVDEIGQGRVWTGSDALGINLVDEIGTLEDAIHYAAVSCGDADIANWKVEGYPKPLTTMEQLMSMISGTDLDEEQILLRKFGDLGKARVEARLPYEIKLSY